ncbi:MAG: hypothetical protein ACI4OO_05000 [Otoolea sp.]|nr:hypothetical protein [Clostridium sp.]MDY5484211.1 hypothetical protein [Clostridium sp.]
MKKERICKAENRNQTRKTAVLQRPYPSICQESAASYGGNQQWFPAKTVQNYGCGLIGAADLLLYLTGEHSEYLFSMEDYLNWIRKLRWYFPLIPGFGMPGWFLSAGLNLYFRFHRLPFRAAWGTGRRILEEEIVRMLQADLPVILSVGAPFPFFWKKAGVTLYRRAEDKSLVPVCRIRAHYVTVTATREETLVVSSWGCRYEIKKEEYEDYVRSCSNRLFSSICRITRRGRSATGFFGRKG